MEGKVWRKLSRGSLNNHVLSFIIITIISQMIQVVKVSNDDSDCNKEIVKLQGEALHESDDQGENRFERWTAKHESQVRRQEHGRAPT